jgi:Uma2 family endonuclease
MAAHPQPRLTPDQYLAIERAADFKSEYYDGYLYAMSGASFRHGVIVGNLSRRLGNQLEGKPCSAIPGDLRVKGFRQRSYMYPDLVVVCGKPEFIDGEHDTLVNPTLLIEVLSKSTESHDRSLKMRRYFEIESLQEYALVSQAEARVEIYRRQSAGSWLLTEFVGLESACRFASIDCQVADCQVPLADIYDKVEFDPSEALPPGQSSTESR